MTEKVSVTSLIEVAPARVWDAISAIGGLDQPAAQGRASLQHQGLPA